MDAAGARWPTGTPPSAEIRGKGLMIGLELVGPDGYVPDPQAAAAVLEGCKDRGLLVGKGGLHGNCLRIAPPLSLTEDEAAEGAAIITEAVDAAARLEGRLGRHAWLGLGGDAVDDDQGDAQEEDEEDAPAGVGAGGLRGDAEGDAEQGDGDAEQ